MESPDLIQWLLTEGGPVIRYRTRVELPDSLTPDGQVLLADVLKSPKTQWLLEQLDHFEPITHVDIGVLNNLHGMKPTCLENIIPRLLERGLHAGIAVFDEKMAPFRQYVDNPLVQRAMDDPAHPTVEGGRAVFIATVLASYFLRAGYESDEIVNFVLRRLELVSKLATERNYNIHLGETELTGLPKQWIGKPILRPEMDPMSGTRPLPLIHDIYAFAHLPAAQRTKQVSQRINQLIAYVTAERYRAFPPGYGYIWSKANPRTCYACGWNLDLPDLDDSNPYGQRKIIQRLELLARFPTAQETAWFRQGMQLLESYQTERGTYTFPSTYLLEKKAGYYVGGEYMGLEDNRRKKTTLELESTFRMLRLKQLIH
jgi:hypothetical protein